ncbi:MAG: hypothetical protein QOE70_2686 [Chthoniobacter sp.]|nr:hypothetical protein [Chthoniobacter sp.]
MLGAVSAAGTGAWMNEPPTAPREAPAPEAPANLSAAFSATGFSVNTANREEVRVFYRTVYPASENVPIGWNGDVAAGNAGTTSAAFREAVQRRVNWFRALAGVPASIALSDVYNGKDQKAALMMSANNALSHNPPPSWTHYSADGAEAAANSNLYLGRFGPSSITGYIEDSGSNNTSAGHRRWILYPQTTTMGTGDLPVTANYASANALWVIDSHYGGARPAVRDDFVAWPPKGFVPHSLVFPRWSFSYPGAKFTNATVAMQRGGASVPLLVMQTQVTGVGENSLVWVPDNLDANTDQPPGVPPATDTPVQVMVNGVMVNNQPRNFTYTVTIFDAQKPGPDTVLPVVTGPARPPVNASTNYTCAAVPRATGYQFRSGSVSPLTATEGAENGTGSVVVEAPAGSAVVSSAYHASGTKSFHLTTPEFERESLTLTRTVLANAGTQLNFKSRFGYASALQVARAQVSADEGVTWADLFSETGTGAPASGFSSHTVPLAAYANRTLQVRFAFAVEGIGNAYVGTNENVGWYLDDVSFTAADELTGATLGAVSSSQSFGFAPASAAAYALQARAQFYGEHLFEWSPVLPVTATAAGPPQIGTHPATQTVNAGDTVQFSVIATGSGTLSYQWFKGAQSIPGATGSTFTISDVQPPATGTYRVNVSNGFGTTPSNTATLTVLIPEPVATTNPGVALSESSVKLNGHVDVHGQTINCGFEYGLNANLGTTVAAGTAAAPKDFEATLSSVAAGSTIYFRAFAEKAGGVRRYGAVRTIQPLAPVASLIVSVDPAGSGTVSGLPAGTVRVGDAIALTAQAASGQVFTGWTGGLVAQTAALSFTMPASMTLVAHFAPSPLPGAPGRYRGLALSTPAAHASCGLVQLKVAAKGAFTGTATIGGVKYPLTGTFDPAGVAHFGAVTEATLNRPAGLPPLLLRLHLPPGAGPVARVLGDVREAAGFVSAIDAPRAAFTAVKPPISPLVNPPDTWPGAYTASLAVDATTPIASLTGAGWTTASIGKDGTARFNGMLADGTKFAVTQPLAKDGTAPFFAVLYAGKGSFIGTATLSGNPVAINAPLRWFRPPGLAGTRFTAGWSNVKLTLQGAGYVPPKLGIDWPLPGLAATGGSAQLTASGAGLAPSLNWLAKFTLKSNRASITPAPGGATATFSVTAATGKVAGNFKPISTATISVPFSGVLLPGQNRSTGFFLNETGSGAIGLKPQ